MIFRLIVLRVVKVTGCSIQNAVINQFNSYSNNFVCSNQVFANNFLSIKFDTNDFELS